MQARRLLGDLSQWNNQTFPELLGRDRFVGTLSHDTQFQRRKPHTKRLISETKLPRRSRLRCFHCEISASKTLSQPKLLSSKLGMQISRCPNFARQPRRTCKAVEYITSTNFTHVCWYSCEATEFKETTQHVADSWHVPCSGIYSCQKTDP